ncbi:CPBP family intramembrane metalloprotease [Ferruginibacter paludis]|uniref:CPBP family intramembrane glutamic endopeptidase n=1 Tax=Ferruginibacter paludis TaxID=1310417 RepID=UPI0025B3623C|nr:CPBP family intramembrane glutamic endopeptidase [Ferruginibacter paludis]MDN3659268.1 CPBP family intramembrane metalloprotease [Ferruginibacter paludis]
MLGCLIYLNYWHNLEKKYAAAPTSRLGRFTGYYLLYFIPFAGAFFLQLLFFKDCSYYKDAWFWIILFLAPALFAFRVNFNWHQQWIINTWSGPIRLFYLHCLNWVVRVFVLLIPVFFIWFIKDKNIQPFYGTKALDSLRPYLLMLLVMIPLLVLAGTQKDFLQVYPKAKLIDTIPVQNWMDKVRYVVFELCYGFDFVSIEFFFRGFLILALMRICGMHCIIPVACFYCAIHLGKPMGEAISSFFGGSLLGIVVYNTGSIWGGLIVHLGIAWVMEAVGWIGVILGKVKQI